MLRAIATARLGPPSAAVAARLAKLSADDVERMAVAASTATRWEDLLGH